MDIGNRAKRAIAELFEAQSRSEEGYAQVDYGRVREVVRRDPEAVAFAAQTILGSQQANLAGWAIWIVASKVYEVEFNDDSLTVLVEAAAKRLGQKLPGINSMARHGAAVDDRRRTIVLQMAEADVAAGDAHRLEMTMSLERLTPEVRSKLIGNCIMTFPAQGDSRPVAHIPRIRAFVADLQKRMPYFPLYLDFDDAYNMRMVYFGCLAAAHATELVDADATATNLHDPSLLAAIRVSLAAIRRICPPLDIDSEPCVTAILDVYDVSIRRELLRGI